MNTSHINRFAAIVGPANCLTAEDDTASYTTDYRKIYSGQALAVVRPADTQQVSEVMAYCYANEIAVAPQGGNTSLVGGSVPTETGAGLPSVVLSLSRLNKVRS